MATLNDAMAELAVIKSKIDALIAGGRELEDKIDDAIAKAKEILDTTAKVG